MRFLKVIAFLFLLSGCQSGENDSVSGDIKPTQISGVLHRLAKSEIYLRYRVGENIYLDTARTQRDSFYFETLVPEAVEAIIFTNDRSKNIIVDGGELPYPGLEIYLAPGQEIKINGSYNNYALANVSGGGDNAALMEIKGRDSLLRLKRRFVTKQYYREDDPVAKDSLSKVLVSILDQINEIHGDYYFNHPYSRPSARFIYQSVYSEPDFSKVDSLYKVLPDSIKNTYYGIKLKQKAEALKNTVKGSLAPDFSKMQPDSTFLSLSDLRGNFVLIDFWGSWCSPCRRAHPELLKLYEAYKPMGFEILSVAQEKESDEQAWENWATAIKEDRISGWNHVLNNAEPTNIDVVKEYAVTAFPTRIMVGPNGTIINREVGYDDNQQLNTLLNDIFNTEGLAPNTD